MTAALVDTDFDLELIDDSKEEFCHMACSCRQHVGLCGAYKAQYHGVPVLSMLPGSFWPTNCTVCKKKICTECIDLVFKPCMNCGL